MSAKREPQKVVHGADVFGWEKVPRSELVALACMSPHSCDARGCPGPENKRKLEAFDDLRAALEELLEWEISMAGLGHPRLDKARAAIALTSPQAK